MAASSTGGTGGTGGTGATGRVGRGNNSSVSSNGEITAALIVAKTTQEGALIDQVYYNSLDFPSRPTHIMIVNNHTAKGVVYKAALSSSTKGYICLNAAHRIALNVALGDMILCHEYTPLPETISKTVTLKVTRSSSKNRTQHFFLESDFLKLFRSEKKKEYFYPGQIYLIFFKENRYVVIITDDSDEGYLNQDTKFKLITDDVNINIISTSEDVTIQRDLFQDNFNFEDLGVGGMNRQLIDMFRRAFASRGISPRIAKKLDIKHVKGILLYGPPGTGKTLIARNIAKKISKVPPKIVNGPEIMNKFVGQSEENIRNLFADAKKDFLEKGDNSDLYVIIFDEIDAICKKRGSSGSSSGVHDTMVNQLLTMIQGPEELNNLCVIAMTNRKDLLDPALLRPGRIEVHIQIALPNKEGREQIFRIHTSSMRTNQLFSNDISISELADQTENYNGSEIEAVVRGASSNAISEALNSDKNDIEENDVRVTSKHFSKALREIVPAFGRSTQTFVDLLPVGKEIEFNDNQAQLFEIVKSTDRLTTCLVSGESRSGKTSLLCTLGMKSDVKYTRLIRPIDLIDIADHDKLKHINNIFQDAYLSEESLVIIDDLEIII